MQKSGVNHKNIADIAENKIEFLPAVTETICLKKRMI
jgi:hypothetical protein